MFIGDEAIDERDFDIYFVHDYWLMS